MRAFDHPGSSKSGPEQDGRPMTLTRRRFLTISAASLAAGPAQAARSTWQGRALGADVSITIHGPHEVAEPALQAARTAIARVEAEFSLFDPTSALSRLNRSGRIAQPDPMMLDLLQAADRVNRMTAGLFDPTIQALWRAHADGSDTGAARKAIGWDRVRVARDAVELDKGQSLTLNGIAQGYATDLVADLHHDADVLLRASLANHLAGHLGLLLLMKSQVGGIANLDERVIDLVVEDEIDTPALHVVECTRLIKGRQHASVTVGVLHDLARAFEQKATVKADGGRHPLAEDLNIRGVKSEVLLRLETLPGG